MNFYISIYISAQYTGPKEREREIELSGVEEGKGEIGEGEGGGGLVRRVNIYIFYYRNLIKYRIFVR